MSSNIVILKSCIFCGKIFIAKTTATSYCGQKCNSNHYKLKAKEKKIQNSLIEQQQTLQSLQSLHSTNSQMVKSKIFLSINDAACLIGVSR